MSKAAIRDRARKRFDHGQPIGGIDTRPMVFVFFFIALIFLLFAQRKGYEVFPQLELPIITTAQVDDEGSNRVVSITTTDVNGREPGIGHLGATKSGECRVYFRGERPVSNEDLYFQAFETLDSFVVHYPHEISYATFDGADRLGPPVLVRADVKVPWKCVAGVIYNLQAAGFQDIKFLTRPIA